MNDVEDNQTHGDKDDKSMRGVTLIFSCSFVVFWCCVVQSICWFSPWLDDTQITQLYGVRGYIILCDTDRPISGRQCCCHILFARRTYIGGDFSPTGSGFCRQNLILTDMRFKWAKSEKNKSAQSNLGTGPRRGTSARGRAAIKARGSVCIVESVENTLLCNTPSTPAITGSPFFNPATSPCTIYVYWFWSACFQLQLSCNMEFHPYLH